ncbi:methyltransferase, TIGR04325 family [Roseibium sp.]|uniref:methyltransferase, TIGR04325 family n=1 Tax=Roseibium sp. TaxID=1936156 RepID=UPI003D12A579
MKRTPISKRIFKSIFPFSERKKDEDKSPVFYRSYDSALRASDGYEDDTLITVVVEKAKKLQNTATIPRLDLTSLRTSIALAASLNSSSLTVLDFGGGAGTHYFVAKTILSDAINLDWRVVETRKMVREAIAQGLETEELRFYASIEEACSNSSVNLVFASGSLQYTDQPYDHLSQLCAIQADCLMITRTPISDDEAIFLQYSRLRDNGWGEIPRELNIEDRIISYPVTILDREKTEALLQTFGEITVNIQEDKSAYRNRSSSYDMHGYLVRSHAIGAASTR